jgi:hypothetical protein
MNISEEALCLNERGFKLVDSDFLSSLGYKKGTKKKTDWL